MNNNMEMLRRQWSTNPLFNRAEQMAAGRTPQELEQVARNLCQQKGLNYDEALAQFKQYFNF